jgi:hypothetical protein
MKSAGAQGQKREQGRAKLLKTKEKKRLDSRARKGVGLYSVQELRNENRVKRNSKR